MNGKIHCTRTELLSVLAKRVRDLRAQRGWSQEAMEELSGLHRNYIGLVERAEVNVGLMNLDRLACAFGLSVSGLLSDDSAQSRDGGA